MRELAELILARAGAAPDAAGCSPAAFAHATAGPDRLDPIDRRRTSLDRLTAWSPVLLLGGLAALTYWLDAQVQPPRRARDGAPRHDPDMYIENFRAVELGADGKPRQSLSATRARALSPTTRPSEFDDAAART